jgi:predicted alpha/beta-hydrolase family hydrolase
MDTIEIETPHGPARAQVDAASKPAGTLVLGHGAGGGVEAVDIQAAAQVAREADFTVVLVEQPYRVAGRKAPAKADQLDAAWEAVVAELRDRGLVTVPLVVGGRSLGARVACRTSGGVRADAVLCLAFPVHPPGKPEKSRVGELLGAGVPTLVIQGERDPMGTPEEFPEGVDLAVVPAADHGLKVPRSGPLDQAGALDLVVESTLEWLVREVTGNP